MIWNHSKHNIRLGGELRRVEQNTETDPNARGTFSFTGYGTSNFNNGFPVPGTGYDFAWIISWVCRRQLPFGFGVASNYLRTWVTTGILFRMIGAWGRALHGKLRRARYEFSSRLPGKIRTPFGLHAHSLPDHHLTGSGYRPQPGFLARVSGS